MTGPALRASAASVLQRVARHPLMRAAAGFAAITSVVKAVAFVKEAVVAAAFGVGATMDSYLMAFVIIGFPSAVLMNAAQTVFIREYVHIISVRGEFAAGRFLRHAVVGLLLALTVVLVVWIALLPGILAVVGHGLTPAQRALVAGNVWRLTPYYYLNGINLLCYGVLQSRKIFLRSALIPIGTPLVIMVLVALGGADLNVLIGSLTLGTALETVLVLVLLSKEQPRAAAPATHGPHNVREFAWGTLMLMPGTLVTGLSPVIEQTIASGLGHGTISALGYAAKLPATLNSLLTTAIGVTILPYFAEQLSRGDEQNCRRFFIRYAGLVTLAGAAIAAAAVLGSGPFVRMAFQRGQFSAQDTLFVTMLQQAYLWQLPGAMAGMVAVRYVAAQGRYRAMTVGSMVMVPITGLLQWSLAEVWGAPGLAVGLSAGATLTAIVYFWIALRCAVRSLSSWKTA
jgi:putative peptidoglycan lipid II flippase